MLDNIAKGKLKKFFKENTLVNQQFIKDNKQSISDYLKSKSENASVTGFARIGLV
jgi:elongation factor Ts